MSASNKIFIAVLGAAIVLGGLVFLSREEPKITKTENVEKSKTPEAGVTKIVDSAPTSGMVVYENGKFSPSRVNLGDTESNCVISVMNKSAAPLLVRLSPHSPTDSQGVLYPEIQPGQSMLLDPRFRIPAIAFHNHRNPREEFSVDLGSVCGNF